ncbi:DNA-directed RNA polymerase subunit beta [Entomospira culicis]|uniref:DNA-directed RNA polymerase subunit beta n=1 Tax=Entomospira culicis TaxID=2719989 RepID=A0A968GJ54_9SPIO|nr:DNA-directed RNA polymerase subunit beta [Entomospira culicis]NIZ19793.1 DNA-directed RNA polymerase subunit beta [Entomospira culicis]NIZ70007.1 DNA-directed RNA polymerase subunit beta [Entomospira culicis]WDI37112.1 DNA-directed RNA polymerase subunit beta [Entomospira culicis]WDI38741.1 DNA-directed RNA polymerase subunit beta [Entomospira culicis]
MFVRKRDQERKVVGEQYEEVVQFPNLIDIQFASYERFLQLEALSQNKPLKRQGLQDVFESTFPIESPNGEFILEYHGYTIDLNAIKFSEVECKQKGVSYEAPLKAKINLVFQNTGEIRQKDIYMGDVPLMTDRGTFIINGAERVVVSQIHRSPGVIFSYEKGIFSSRIIPYRGSWLEFEVDPKKNLIFTKIDRKKRILGTLFLRALGFESREEILNLFYKTEEMDLVDDVDLKNTLLGRYLAKPVFVLNEDGTQRRLFRAGDRIYLHELDAMLHAGVKSVELIDFIVPGSVNSDIILKCFEWEDSRDYGDKDDAPNKEDALTAVYDVLMPGEPMTVENAEKDLHSTFFSSRRYDLGSVGRYKINKKFGYENPDHENTVLTKEDIAATMRYLMKVYTDAEQIDDIDHLGNRRVRSVGELLTNAMKSAFSRMERNVKERMSIKEVESLKPQDIISIKPIVSAIKEFFGSSQLSQFMDQCNPLGELTHKRRLNALGPGGLTRDRAGFEVRDVHYTHYGRMCPIETPEGPNIGLIMSLANYARVNEYGFLESPYRKVVKGKVTKEVEYLSAIDEERYLIAQAGAPIDEQGRFLEEQVAVRKAGDYTTSSAPEISYMDVSPKQIISTAASLIPFLEHDDANRALMGCNMQRQAVPLLFPEAPLVGTGMEMKAAYDSGVLLKAKHAGEVIYSSSVVVKVRRDEDPSIIDEYPLTKFQRTNQDTCFNQTMLARKGDKVAKGDILVDGPAIQNGELALGRNLLVGFVPWMGYNYEDAVLISQRVIKEDHYTSVHISEFITEVRETKLGPEKITKDIPNTNERALAQLSEEGIVRVGALVQSGSILVGKVTPKNDADTTPEFKLLNSIFGEKAKEVRDSSLKLPHGVEGTVVDVQRLKRSAGDELDPGVEEVVKVLIATKRKLRVGDKMAGRHGNKGVVARIVPESDMPYMADGTPLDICLNPLGVPSRMNIGQIMETALGMVAAKRGEHYATPVFQSPSNDFIDEELAKLGIDQGCTMTLYDGLTGEPLRNPVFVGYMYYLKLHHLVDDKMHARSTGPYSLVTQQPLGGKAQFGGQRLGEMEVWALEAYGAANTLQELLTVKSDDMNGRAKIYEAIVKGEPTNPAGIPEAFNVMVQELRGLALNLSLSDARGNPVPLTERDEELLSKRGESGAFNK